MELHLTQMTPNIWKEEFGISKIYINIVENTINVKIGDHSKITYNYEHPLTIQEIIELKQRIIKATKELESFLSIG